MYADHVLVTVPLVRRHAEDIPYVGMRSTIMASLAGARLTPVAVSAGIPYSAIDRLYQQCAAVVFTGGSDWNPARYHQAPAPETQPPDDERDAVELYLLGKALADKKPLIGICRGAQGLAIALRIFHKVTDSEKSILIQEIKYTASGRHDRPYEELPTNKHGVTISSHTLAHEIFGQTELAMPKAHHQAVNKTALIKLPNVVISGVSTRDGFVEMFELNRQAHPFCFALQGHPEVDETLFRPLFDRLTREAQRYTGGDTYTTRSLVKAKVHRVAA